MVPPVFLCLALHRRRRRAGFLKEKEAAMGSLLMKFRHVRTGFALHIYPLAGLTDAAREAWLSRWL